MSYELSFIGLLISGLFIGVTGFYPGGIIVPSYLVLFVNQPERILGTIIVSLLTLLCYKITSKYFILFGRRRFIFMLTVAGSWTFLWFYIFPVLFPLSPEFRVIGWVIPGLIANHFEKQGVTITLASLVSVTTCIYITGRIIYRFI